MVLTLSLKRADVLKLHLPQRSLSDQQEDRGGFNLKAQTSEMSLRTQASVVFHFMVGPLVKFSAVTLTRYPPPRTMMQNKAQMAHCPRMWLVFWLKANGRGGETNKYERGSS